jgi:hypothetical protein
LVKAARLEAAERTDVLEERALCIMGRRVIERRDRRRDNHVKINNYCPIKPPRARRGAGKEEKRKSKG